MVDGKGQVPGPLPTTTSPDFHGGARSRISPRHEAHISGATRRWITCRRTSGSVGRCVVSLRRGFIFGEPDVEKEGERDHREKCVVMKPKPGAPLEMIEAELLLGLLVHLFAGPARLDGGDDLPA